MTARPPTIGGQGDDDLMRRVQHGDADAFAELYERHATRALRVARAVCGDTGNAEDAVQEGFLGVWRSRASYREGVSGFQGWAMGIVRNRAIDSGRRTAARRRLQTAEGVEDPRRIERDAVSTEDAVAADLGRGAMLASLRLLPEPQEEVIVLAFYGELSQPEIALQLDLPLGTVKSRMRLGLRKLRLGMPDG
jgi:RNA polymerase sigma-70 factor, ECF subfamily